MTTANDAPSPLQEANADGDPSANGEGPDREEKARAALPDDEPVLVQRQSVGDVEMALAFRGSLQMRAFSAFGESTHAFADGDLATENGFQLRRLRLAAEATVLPVLSMRVVADVVDALMPAAAKGPLFLAYANADLRLVQVQAGLMRVPFSRHALVDETRLLFFEPPTAWRSDRFHIGRGDMASVLPDRRPGVAFHEEISGYDFAFGAFSGGELPNAAGAAGAGTAAAATEPLGSAIFAGRIEIGPWGPVPLEGAYFPADFEYDAPRLALAVGGLGRTGAAGVSRALSASAAGSYRGFFASVEIVLGEGRGADTAGPAPPMRSQRGVTADVAYRIPVHAPFHQVEFGLRGDDFHVGVGAPGASPDAAGDLRTLSAVANLYFWRHRVKAGSLFRVVLAPDASGAARSRHEGVLELTVGF